MRRTTKAVKWPHAWGFTISQPPEKTSATWGSMSPSSSRSNALSHWKLDTASEQERTLGRSFVAFAPLLHARKLSRERCRRWFCASVLLAKNEGYHMLHQQLERVLRPATNLHINRGR